jgi:hypothetical protein
MLGVIVLYFSMQSFVYPKATAFLNCYAEYRYAECRYALCRYVESRSTYGGAANGL